MKALIIGLGSIGNRHLKHLRGCGGIDVICCRSGWGGAASAEAGCLREFYDLVESINDKPDFAIISNPTSLHVETALLLARAGIPFFMEKPVSNDMSGVLELEKLVADRKLPVLVGFQMRYHHGYQKMMEIIMSGEIGKPISLQGYIGQYLPDWRPQRDYRQSSSAKRALGGGVISDLSHEIDIAISVFGGAGRISCICGNYTNLEIETEDIANIIIEHRDGISQIHLNYLERGYEWVTRVAGTEGSVVWDYGKGFTQLISSKSGTKFWTSPEGFNRDTLFGNQFLHWLKVLRREVEPAVSLASGIQVTRVISAAKQSSEQNKHIFL